MTENYKDSCNNGILDINNTLTLCNCRDESGRILDEYGWHCSKPNSEICENRIGLGYTKVNAISYHIIRLNSGIFGTFELSA